MYRNRKNNINTFFNSTCILDSGHDKDGTLMTRVLLEYLYGTGTSTSYLYVLHVVAHHALVAAPPTLDIALLPSHRTRASAPSPRLPHPPHGTPAKCQYAGLPSRVHRNREHRSLVPLHGA